MAAVRRRIELAGHRWRRHRPWRLPRCFAENPMAFRIGRLLLDDFVGFRKQRHTRDYRLGPKHSRIFATIVSDLYSDPLTSIKVAQHGTTNNWRRKKPHKGGVGGEENGQPRGKGEGAYRHVIRRSCHKIGVYLSHILILQRLERLKILLAF